MCSPLAEKQGCNYNEVMDMSCINVLMGITVWILS